MLDLLARAYYHSVLSKHLPFPYFINESLLIYIKKLSRQLLKILLK